MEVIGAKRSACTAFAEKDHLILTHVPAQIEADHRLNHESELKGFQYVYEQLKLHRLCPLSEMSAETFLTNLLKHRGYSTEKRPAIDSSYKRAIKQHELQSYSKDLLNAISHNDLVVLKELCDKQQHIFACNQFGESTLHMAARKSFPRIVQLIFKSELETPLTIDDYGRSPLTDAFWAISPSFSIIEQILDHSVDLLFLTDVRGFTPLNYLRQEHVFKLCLFFYSRREKYWPIQRDDRSTKVARVEVSS